MNILCYANKHKLTHYFIFTFLILVWMLNDPVTTSYLESTDRHSSGDAMLLQHIFQYLLVLDTYMFE